MTATKVQDAYGNAVARTDIDLYALGGVWASPPTPGNLLVMAMYRRGASGGNPPGSEGDSMDTGWTLAVECASLGLGEIGVAVSIWTKVATLGETSHPWWISGHATGPGGYDYALQEWSGVGGVDSTALLVNEFDATHTSKTVHTPTAAIDGVLIAATGSGGNTNVGNTAYGGATLDHVELIGPNTPPVNGIAGMVHLPITNATGSYSIGVTDINGFHMAAVSVMLTEAFVPPPPPEPGTIIVVSDPEGVFIGSIEDAYDKIIQIEHDGPGSGTFKLNRYSADATAEKLKPGNLISVTIPRIDSDPLLTFMLEEESVKLIATDEAGGEYFDVKGRGNLAYPDRAIWQAHTFVIPWWVGATSPSAGDIGQLEIENGAVVITYNLTGSIVTSKGSFTAGTGEKPFYDTRKSYHFDPADGYPSNFTRVLVHLSSGPHAGQYVHVFDTYFTDHYHSLTLGLNSTVLLTDISPDTPGYILYYMWLQALASDRPIHPTPIWAIDFDATTDSNGDPWSTTDALAGMTTELGENYFATIERLIGTGVIDVEMSPDMVMHAYNAPRGVDRTSTTFAAGKVRFVKGVNIADELERHFVTQPIATWAEVIGTDEQLTHVTLPGSSGLIPRETSIRSDSDDETSLSALGIAELQRQQIEAEGASFLITTDDDDELAGKYLPGPVGSDHGKFWTGDTVTVSTGSDENDYVNADTMISNITIEEGPNQDGSPNLSITVTTGRIGMRSPAVHNPTAHGVGVTSATDSGTVAHDEIVGNDAAGSHPATAVTFAPTGTIAATNVQAAIAEAALEAIQVALLTTQDDIIVRSATAPARLAKGSDGQVLTVDPITHHLIWATPTSGSALTVKDEGTPLATDATSLDFVGSGVTASGATAAKTITIPGETLPVTIIDAKGDLIAGTANDTAARLPVGTDGYVLSADSSQTTGLIWVPAASSSGLTIKDEGSSLATDATSLDFVGAGVVASGTGAAKTITIAGASPGGWPLDRYSIDATYGDHFTGGSLNARWTRRNYASGAEAYAQGIDATYLRIAKVGRSNGDGYFQTAPSGDWTFAMKYIPRFFTDGSSGIAWGIGVVDSAGSGVATCIYHNPRSYLLINATTYSSYGGTFVMPGTTGTNQSVSILSGQGVAIDRWVWVYLRKSGTSYYIAYSFDGEIWGPESPALTWSGTVDRIAMMDAPLGAVTSGTGNGSYMDVDWFNKIA